jgi:hypothetical protein
LSAGIRTLRGPAPGFGSVRVEAKIGSTTWRTSLFPDSKTGSFLLPLKARVRALENITAGDRVALSVEILL